MDPSSNLLEQLALSHKLLDDEYEVDAGDACRLAELVIALDEWIRKGGFKPAPWQDCGTCHGHGGSCLYCKGTGVRQNNLVGRCPSCGASHANEGICHACDHVF
jgi:hypothetical protein